eukprot:TRINITY_DN76101_c0_g1_i1.p1 TRINITY_DN76101_c0_g1~~TRINITY_DN76101_c0_g1_i1.p1  ORF type:complete len:419 (-),score=84.05 TRINITY_DN76101_c0_g1_i1:115-1320(-)
MGSSEKTWRAELERRVEGRHWQLLSKEHLAKWLELHGCPMPFALECDAVGREQLIKVVLKRLGAERREVRSTPIADTVSDVQGSCPASAETPLKPAKRSQVEEPDRLASSRKLRKVTPLLPYKTKEWIQSNWQFSRLLGSGTSSRVRLGLQKQSGQEYAVKVVDLKRLELQRSKKRSSASLLSEVEIAKTFCHPGIVQCHESFQTSEHLYIIMEFVPGGSLTDHIIEEGYFIEDLARPFFQKLCSALCYLHEKKVVHRDIKGDNILLPTKERRGMQPKLSDFGTSSYCLGTHDHRTCVGTLLYMAPEVFTLQKVASSRGYGRRVDMWSLGVVLYILLCGAPPFDAFDFSGKLDFAEEEWLAVSSSAKDLVSHLIELEPSQRLTSQGALMHDWCRAATEGVK